MHKVANLPIKWKLALVIVAVATAISITEILLFTAYDAQSYEAARKRRLLMIAEIVGTNSSSALQFRDESDAFEVLSSLRTDPSIRVAYLLDAEGAVLGEFVAEGQKTGIAPPLPAESSVTLDSSGKNFIAFHRIMLNGRFVGSIYFVSDLRDFMARKKERYALGGIAVVGFFLLSLLLALRLQRMFTAPIESLADTMEQITKKNDYSLRATKQSDDEFGELVDGFNYMVSEVEKRDHELETRMRLLTQSNQELDQFVYVASHDLKAPLRAVDNLSQLIAKATADLLPPDKREYLDLMHNRVKRMERLFDDLLFYSRIGRVAIKDETVNLTALIRDIVDLLAPPPDFNIKYSNELPRIKTAKTPLETVLRNLIANAIKHHHRTDGNIVITATEREHYVEFAVCDDGPGIPAKYHEKIFQMFQTLRSRDEVEGSGMGLALVKKMVEKQNGKIWLTSAEGEGTCFYFTWMKR